MTTTTVTPVPAPSRKVVTGVVLAAGGLALLGLGTVVGERLATTTVSAPTVAEVSQLSPQQAAELAGQRLQDQALDQAAKLGAHQVGAAAAASSWANATKNAYEQHFGTVPGGSGAVALPKYVHDEQVGGAHGTYPFTGTQKRDQHDEGAGYRTAFGVAPTSPTNHQYDEQVGGRHGTYAWSPAS